MLTNPERFDASYKKRLLTCVLSNTLYMCVYHKTVIVLASQKALMSHQKRSKSSRPMIGNL